MTLMLQLKLTQIGTVTFTRHCLAVACKWTIYYLIMSLCPCRHHYQPVTSHANSRQTRCGGGRPGPDKLGRPPLWGRSSILTVK